MVWSKCNNDARRLAHGVRTRILHGIPSDSIEDVCMRLEERGIVIDDAAKAFRVETRGHVFRSSPRYLPHVFLPYCALPLQR